MKDQKTSVLSNGLLWFGAAVSIAEILTGTYLSTLGFQKGLAAIFLGHMIGCLLLFLAGLIGGQTGRSAMESVKSSFGQKGAILFSALNILQLIGWTAIMIISGARAAATLIDPVLGFSSTRLWCLVIGGLVLVWILIGIRNLGKWNTVVMAALFLLTILLSMIVFQGDLKGEVTNDLSFGAAVELSAAMPLSWLPLISDYTREARKPVCATAVSSIVYFLASSWMYIIGMAAAIFTGETDIAAIMLQAGMGILGVITIIIATVSTTFLDAFSAGVSAASISTKIKEKKAAIAIGILGTALAVFAPVENFESFLYLIGSVFAPMIAIQITDYFILKRKETERAFDVLNLITWVLGFFIYRIFLNMDTPAGSTLPAMAIVVAISLATQGIRHKVSKNRGITE